MAARIVEGLVTCSKRWALEDELAARGHRFNRKRGQRGPASALDCLVLLLCFLDRRRDPRGRLYGVDDATLEREAMWAGEAGLLVACLVHTGWIDETPQGRRWHDYAGLNASSIRGKNRRDQDDDDDDDNAERGVHSTPPRKGDTTLHQNRGIDHSPETGGRSGSGSEGLPLRGRSLSERAREGAAAPRRGAGGGIAPGGTPGLPKRGEPGYDPMLDPESPERTAARREAGAWLRQGAKHGSARPTSSAPASTSGEAGAP